MKKMFKILSIVVLSILLATYPVAAQDSTRPKTTARTEDMGNRENGDDYGKWGLAGLLGLLGLLGLRRRDDDRVEVRRKPNG